MINSRFNRRIIKLDNVRQNNIVYIDLNKPLAESVFEQEYKKAARIIRDIIIKHKPRTREADNRCKACSNRDCDSCNYRDYTSYHESKGHLLNLTQCQTAVPFIGDRGTGKTSIMCSVLECLKNYDGNNSDAPFYLGSDLGDPRFITFDMIDANMLKKSDDVMEIILARMLSYLEALHPDCDFRDLYRQIDELHENLCLVRDTDKGNRDEYGLSVLQRIADSQNAVEGFRKLVADFLQTMSVHKFNCHPCYLIIALDDIDMYRGFDWGLRDSQFALLEHIYNHMRIPGLIVLMTFNENILKRTCNRHFESIYFGEHVSGKYSQTEREAIDLLTGQFMSKLFPQEQRIYLPNYLLIDSANRSNLFVVPTLRDGNQTKVLHPFSSSEEISVKEFMLCLIAYRTGVYFDAAGSKQHFFEPRNLRELGELFQVIMSMDDFTESVEDTQYIDAVRSRNRQMLLNYLYNQYALRHLDSEEYEHFRSISTLPLVRQNKSLIYSVHQQMIGSMQNNSYTSTSNKDDQWKYCYGELLHSIYLSTRMAASPDIKRTFFSKGFIHCILGTRSILMNEIVQSDKARQDMLLLIGSSIAGQWANEMLPSFSHEDYSDPLNGGSINLRIKDFFNWEIPNEVQQAILQLNSGDNPSSELQVRAFIEALVVAGMFFTDIPASGLGIVLDADMNDDDKATLYLRSESSELICYNVMNFAINLFNNSQTDGDEEFQGYLAYIHEKLEKLGYMLAVNLSRDWRENKSQAENAKILLEQNEHSKAQRNPSKAAYPPDLTVTARNVATVERAINRASAWIALTKNQAHQNTDCNNIDSFVRNWNSILRGVLRDFTRSIRSWQQSYHTLRFVLPVQHFDMMYNIIKRLADRSYHDVPDNAPVSEVFDYYVHLYENLEEELVKQDKIYHVDKQSSFAAALNKSVFFKIITSKEKDKRYNPYVKEVIVSMVRSTARRQARRSHTNIGI